jgi:hypothetical protein
MARGSEINQDIIINFPPPPCIPTLSRSRPFNGVEPHLCNTSRWLRRNRLHSDSRYRTTSRDLCRIPSWYSESLCMSALMTTGGPKKKEDDEEEKRKREIDD